MSDDDKKPDYPKVTWKSLTPTRLRSLAGDVADDAHDKGIDRDNLIEEQGHDVVGEMEALVRFLLREAARREAPAMAPTPSKYVGRRARLKLTRAK